MRDELKKFFWGSFHTTLKGYPNGTKKGVSKSRLRRLVAFLKIKNWGCTIMNPCWECRVIKSLEEPK